MDILFSMKQTQLQLNDSVSKFVVCLHAIVILTEIQLFCEAFKGFLAEPYNTL